MASEDDERRRIERIRFEAPLEARMERTPVTLLDVSASGARIEHSFPLAKARIIKLSFEYEGRSLTIACHVVRCHLEKVPRGAMYRSGLTFDREDTAYVELRAMIADAVMKDFVARRAHIESVNSAH